VFVLQEWIIHTLAHQNFDIFNSISAPNQCIINIPNFDNGVLVFKIISDRIENPSMLGEFTSFNCGLGYYSIA